MRTFSSDGREIDMTADRFYYGLIFIIMKALSDETRLRILNLLERGCCVCEVIQALDISQAQASRTLGILQNAGFLKARRDGAWMHYSVDWETPNSYTTALSKLLKVP